MEKDRIPAGRRIVGPKINVQLRLVQALLELIVIGTFGYGPVEQAV